jgi:hypothetical protein
LAEVRAVRQNGKVPEELISGLMEFLTLNTTNNTHPSSLLSLLQTAWVDRTSMENDLGTLNDHSQRCLASGSQLTEVEIWDIFRDVVNGVRAATSQMTECRVCLVCLTLRQQGSPRLCGHTLGPSARNEWYDGTSTVLYLSLIAA